MPPAQIFSDYTGAAFQLLRSPGKRPLTIEESLIAAKDPKRPCNRYDARLDSVMNAEACQGRSEEDPHESISKANRTVTKQGGRKERNETPP